MGNKREGPEEDILEESGSKINKKLQSTEGMRGCEALEDSTGAEGAVGSSFAGESVG